jgi:hypothetical protein
VDYVLRRDLQVEIAHVRNGLARSGIQQVQWLVQSVETALLIPGYSKCNGLYRVQGQKVFKVLVLAVVLVKV